MTQIILDSRRMIGKHSGRKLKRTPKNDFTIEVHGYSLRSWALEDYNGQMIMLLFEDEFRKDGE